MARTPGQGSSLYVSFNYGFMAPHEERCGELWGVSTIHAAPLAASRALALGGTALERMNALGACEAGPEDGQGWSADDPSPLREQRAGTFGSDEWYGVTNAGCRMDIAP